MSGNISSAELVGWTMWAEACGRAEGDREIEERNDTIVRLNKMGINFADELNSKVTAGQQIIHALKSRNAVYEEMIIGLMRHAVKNEIKNDSNEDLRQFIRQSSRLFYPDYVSDKNLVDETPVNVYRYVKKDSNGAVNFFKKELKLNDDDLSVIADPDLFEKQINEKHYYGMLKNFAAPPYPTDHSAEPLPAWVDAFKAELKDMGLSKMLDGITVNRDGKPVTLQFVNDFMRHNDHRVHTEDIESIPVAIAAFWEGLQQQIPALEVEARRKAEEHGKKGFFSKMTDSDNGSTERTRIVNIRNKIAEINPEAAAIFKSKIPAYIASALECNARADALRALFEKQVARRAEDEASMKVFAESLHEAYLREPEQA